MVAKRLTRDYSKVSAPKVMDQADAVFMLYGKDITEKNSFAVKCPIHGGKSLWLTLKEDGHVRTYCHGCGGDDDANKAFIRWAASQGVHPKTWRRPSKHRGTEKTFEPFTVNAWESLPLANGQVKKIAAKKPGVPIDVLDDMEMRLLNGKLVYAVWDASGNRLLSHRTWAGKNFINPAGSGSGSHLVIPWELTREEPVWLCESETTAWAMAGLGYQVAWIPGASMKPPEEELRRLAGYDARVAYDAGPAGRKGSEWVSGALRAVGARVRVVQWPEGTSDNWDLRDELNACEEDGETFDPEALLGEEIPAFSFSFLPRGSISNREEIKPTALFDLGGAMPALFYDEGFHMLFGESEGGKSWVAQAAVAEVLKDGGTALYLDYEKSLNEVLDRFSALGVTDEEIARLAYVDATSFTRAELDAAVESSSRFDLTIIDGVTSSLRQYGKKGREEDDVTDWYRVLPRRMAGCVVAIDHVAKPSKENGGVSDDWAIGSQSKKSIITGVSYRVLSVDVLARGRIGEVKLRVAKDARGYVNAKAGSDRVLVSLAFDATEDGTMVVRVAEERSAGATNKAIEGAIDLMVRESFSSSQRTAERWLKEQMGLSMHRARAAYHEYVERGFLDEARKTAEKPSASARKSASKPRSSTRAADALTGESSAADALKRKKGRFPRSGGESTVRRRSATHPARGTKPG